MPITVSEIGQSLGQPRAGRLERGVGRSYTRHFLAITDDPSIGPKAVRDAVPVALGQHYHAGSDEDFGSFVQSISVTEDGSADDGCQWIATVEYSPYNTEIQPLNPLDMEPQVSFTWGEGQTPAAKDINDDPVLNSAEDPFDPPIMKDDAPGSFKITVNMVSFSPAIIDQYQNTINDAEWYGLPARSWKLRIHEASRTKHPDIGHYWTVTFEFQSKRDTWTKKVLDQGMRQINSAGKKVNITDAEGNQISEPWPLDADGLAKPKGELADTIEFDVYREVDFSALGFDAFLATL